MHRKKKKKKKMVKYVYDSCMLLFLNITNNYYILWIYVTLIYLYTIKNCIYVVYGALFKSNNGNKGG